MPAERTLELDLDLDAILAHYRTHGWARVGRVASEEVLAGLRERVDDLMLARVPVDEFFYQHDSRTGSYDDLEYGKGFVGPSLGYRKIEKLERDPRFRAWIDNEVYARIAHAWLGPQVSLYRAVVFAKAAAAGAAPGGTELPWHQDGGQFWGIDRAATLQIWIALDDAPLEAGCVEVVPGTHLGGLTTPAGGVVPVDKLALVDIAAKKLALPARAGEVLLIHNHAWHRSGQNTTPQPRRALTVCLMDAATRCLRKKYAPRQFVRLFE